MGPRYDGEEMNGKGAILFWPLQRKNSSNGGFHDAPSSSPFPSSSLRVGRSDEGQQYEYPTGYYVNVTSAVYNTVATLGNYLSSKLHIMVFLILPCF